jgi:hypothetical protein
LSHLIYDAVFLLPALVLFVTRTDGWAIVGGIGLGLHWYGLRVMDALGLTAADLTWALVSCGLYTTVLVCAFLTGRRRPAGAPSAGSSRLGPAD